MLLTFIVVTFSVSVMLFGLTLFLQKYLYHQPADMLIVRAAVGGFVMGTFITFWTYVNTRADSPNKYGTFFQFNPTASKEYAEFDAIRLYPHRQDAERNKTVHFARYPAPNSLFLEDKDPTKPFRLNSSDYITVAIIVKDGGKDLRCDAELKDGKIYASPNKRFKEVGGSRYLEGETPNVVFAPSSGALFLALFLNLLIFVIWVTVFWPVLRFGLGHAIVLAIILGFAVIVVLMPLLFDRNKVAPPPSKVPAASAT